MTRTTQLQNGGGPRFSLNGNGYLGGSSGPVRLVSAETVPLTGEIARYISEMDSLKGERRLSEVRLELLRKSIQSGAVTVFRWAIVSILEQDGAEYRINGQHSSHLFSVGLLEPVGYVTIERYECKTAEDAANLWSRFDAPLSTRTNGNTLSAVLRSIPGGEEIPISLATRAVSALAWWHYAGVHPRELLPFDRAQLAVEHIDFVRWLNEASDIPRNDTRLCKPVWCAIYTTYRADKSMARKFWGEVFGGTNTNPQSGSRQLDRYLLSTMRRTGQLSRRAESINMVLEFCLDAWEKWNAGEVYGERGMRRRAAGLRRFKYLPAAVRRNEKK